MKNASCPRCAIGGSWRDVFQDSDEMLKNNKKHENNDLYCQQN
jgi:hypothetical protein